MWCGGALFCSNIKLLGRLEAWKTENSAAFSSRDSLWRFRFQRSNVPILRLIRVFRTPDSAIFCFSNFRTVKLTFVGEDYSFKVPCFIPQLRNVISNRIKPISFVVLSQRGAHSQFVKVKLQIFVEHSLLLKKNTSLSSYWKKRYFRVINK